MNLYEQKTVLDQIVKLISNTYVWLSSLKNYCLS